MKHLLEEKISNKWTLSIVEVAYDENRVINKVYVIKNVEVMKKSDYKYIKRELLFEIDC